MRYEYAQALSQDILGEAEAMWANPRRGPPQPGTCVCTNQRTTIDPSEEFLAGRAPVPAVFVHPMQLDALECDHRLTHPYAHNERIRYLDVVRDVDIPRGRVLDGQARAWELVRMPFVQWGVGVVETIAINVIAQALDAEGTPVGPPFNVAAAPPLFLLGAPNPCPFPIAHPGGADLPPLTLEFSLMNYIHSRRVSRTPPMLTAALATQLPLADNIISPWSDMRYFWESRYSTGHQWIRGGHSLVRLFVAMTSGIGFWQLQVCGRLAGFWQYAGRDGGALRNALVRSG